MVGLGMSTSGLASRFWRFVEVAGPDDCWLWVGGRTSNGYGQMWSGVYSGGHAVPVRAHRASYVIHYGEIPEGKYVCHTCDNRLCVNPAHLWLGTHSDNMLDMRSKGRAVPPPTRYGVVPRKKDGTHIRAKVTEDDVRAVRADPESGIEKGRRRWAERLGVTPENIRAIVNRRSWKYVE